MIGRSGEQLPSSLLRQDRRRSALPVNPISKRHTKNRDTWRQGEQVGALTLAVPLFSRSPDHPISRSPDKLCLHPRDVNDSLNHALPLGEPGVGGLLVFAAPDDSKSLVTECGSSESMNRNENQVFENQHVVLDDGVYVNCKFKNCSLEYSGGDVYVQNCQGEGCQLVWRGAAQRTVLLLQGLGLMVPPPPPPGSEPGSRVQ